MVVDEGTRPAAVRPARASAPPWARLVGAGVVVAALAPVGVYLYVALHQIGYPYELEWMEGGAVEIVGRVLHGQALYTAPSLHYVPYTYPPLYFWVSALVARITGLGFLPLRLVSFTASLGCFAVLFRLVQRETRSPLAGVVAAGLFAATYQVGGAWLDIGRVDSLYLFLLLLAVAMARRAEGVAGGVGAGLLMSAAFLTKQSALFAVGPLVVYLLVTRRRCGVAALGALAVVVVGSTLVLDASSHGWYAYYVLDELTHQGIDWSIWFRFVPGDLVGRVGWMMGLGLVGLFLSWRRRGDGTLWPFWLAVAAGFVVSSWIARAHVGGGQDVLIPAYAAVALLGGLGYHSIATAADRRPLVATAVLAVLAVQVVSISGHPSHLVPSRASRLAGERFVAQVAATPGEVIVLDHPWYDTLAGKEAWAQDEAVHDVLRAGPSRARTDLVRSIRRVLASPQVRVVYTDSTSVDPVIARELRRYYRLGPPVFSCYQCFFPVTDVAFRPYLRYVRR